MITDADPGLVGRLAEVLELRAADPQQAAMRQAYLGDSRFPAGARVLEVRRGPLHPDHRRPGAAALVAQGQIGAEAATALRADTVRYCERVGLLRPPAWSAAGHRRARVLVAGCHGRHAAGVGRFEHDHAGGHDAPAPRYPCRPWCHARTRHRVLTGHEPSPALGLALTAVAVAVLAATLLVSKAFGPALLAWTVAGVGGRPR